MPSARPAGPATEHTASAGPQMSSVDTGLDAGLCACSSAVQAVAEKPVLATACWRAHKESLQVWCVQSTGVKSEGASQYGEQQPDFTRTCIDAL